MMEKNYEYYGYLIEIHEHPIYHDFEYVIKSMDGQVVTASSHQFDYSYDAEKEAELTINGL